MTLMNFLTILLIYVLNIRSIGDICEVERVFFLENNFWYVDHNQLQINNGYLYEVCIVLEHKNGFTDSFGYRQEKCYTLKSTNLGYLVLKNSLKKDIILFLESSDNEKKLIKFQLLFFDKPIEINRPRDWEIYKGRIQGYITYKLLEKISENILNLRNIVTDNDYEHVKDKFGVSLQLKLLRLYEFVKILDEKKEVLNEIKHDVDFNLFYFKNHSECLLYLKDIIKKLCYLKLQKDDDTSDSFTAEFFKMSFNNTTTIKVSELKNCLSRKFNENIKLNDSKFDEIWRNLFDKCFYYLENEMLNNRIFFPIGCKYDIDYYIEHFSNLIYESVKERQEKYIITNSKFKCLFPYKMINSLRINLKNLPLIVMKDLYETEYVPKHFLKLFGKEVKTLDDYNNIDKILVDYFNMLKYIINPYFGLQNNKSNFLLYFSPIYPDNYNLRIIDGIKIKTNFFAEVRKIKGFDDKGEEIAMVENTDYFIDDSGKLYCPSNVLKLKNVQEIEVISSDNEKSNKRFKVNEYLSI